MSDLAKNLTELFAQGGTIPDMTEKQSEQLKSDFDRLRAIVFSETVESTPHEETDTSVTEIETNLKSEKDYTCTECNKSLTEAEIKWCQSRHGGVDVIYQHPACLAPKYQEKEVSISKSQLDILNAALNLLSPESELSPETNEKAGMIHAERFYYAMSETDLILAINRVTGIATQLNIMLGKNRERAMRVIKERESEKFEKAMKVRERSERPIKEQKRLSAGDKFIQQMLDLGMTEEVARGMLKNMKGVEK